MFEKLLLHGHKESITCLDSTYEHLVTGSEDKSVRLWDSRSQRASHCFLGFNNEVEIVKFSLSEPSRLYATSNSTIYMFDLRKLSDSVIIKAAIATMDCDDDIMAIREDKRYASLFIGDSSGSIRVVDTNDGIFTSSSRVIMSEIHSNIIGDIVLGEELKKPKPFVITGGFDCKLNKVDLHKMNITKTYDFNVEKAQVDGVTNMLNPPFVHGLLLTNREQVLVAALGDGSVRLH